MLFLVLEWKPLASGGERTCDTLSIAKASVQAPTITGLIQLACLVSYDSLHLRTHLQLFVSVMLAPVPLSMRGDRGCLFNHDVHTIVGYGKRQCGGISGACLGYTQVSQHGCDDGNDSCFSVQTPCYHHSALLLPN